MRMENLIWIEREKGVNEIIQEKAKKYSEAWEWRVLLVLKSQKRDNEKI